jgi:hypothetical protein
MLCLLILLIKPKILTVQVVLFLSVFIAAIFEMAAWQPWEYQYLCMLGVFILNRKNPASLYTALILIMACIYFYSGLQKFNGGFLHSVWKGLILKKFFGISDVNLIVHYAGLALPIIEGLAGLGLVILKRKKLAAYILISMHFFILVLLGTVQGYNIVLPWNVVMIIILHFLFIKNDISFSPQLLFTKKNIIIFVLWAVMPATSFLGYWEQKLSSNLFSGKYKHLIICVNKSPKELEPYLTEKFKICQNKFRLSVSEWAAKEIAVIPPTSNWYYTKFKYNLIKKKPEMKGKFYTVIYPYQKGSTI